MGESTQSSAHDSTVPWAALVDAPEGLRAIAATMDAGMSEDGTSMDLTDEGYAAEYSDSLVRWAYALSSDAPDGLVAAAARFKQLSMLFARIHREGSRSMPSSPETRGQVQDALRGWAGIIETALREGMGHAAS